jgi:hypothetical protein
VSRFGHFGRCEAEDTCVLDPACEFYAVHEGDDEPEEPE